LPRGRPDVHECEPSLRVSPRVGPVGGESASRRHNRPARETRHVAGRAWITSARHDMGVRTPNLDTPDQQRTAMHGQRTSSAMTSQRPRPHVLHARHPHCQRAVALPGCRRHKLAGRLAGRLAGTRHGRTIDPEYGSSSPARHRLTSFAAGQLPPGTAPRSSRRPRRPRLRHPVAAPRRRGGRSRRCRSAGPPRDREQGGWCHS
jgi:hypothetical protein